MGGVTLILNIHGDSVMKTRSNGTLEWVSITTGKTHRGGDLPACIHPDGSMEWWVDGTLRRRGGLPSLMQQNGDFFWWEEDVPSAPAGLPHQIRVDGTIVWSEKRENDLPTYIDRRGTMKWTVNGAPSRDRGLPSDIKSNGDLSWFKNAIYAREGGLPTRFFKGDMSSYVSRGSQNENMRPSEILSNGIVWMHKMEPHRIGGAYRITNDSFGYGICGVPFVESDYYDVIEKLGGEEVLRALPYPYVQELFAALVG